MIRNLVFTSLVLTLTPSSFAADIPAIATEKPGGNYQTLWLTLLGEAWPEASDDVRVFVGLRDGKGSTAWICNAAMGKTRIWIDENTVSCDGKKVSGSLKGVFGNYPQDTFSFQFDGGLNDSGFAGTYSGTVDEAKTTGTWTGTLADGAELAKANGIASGQDWPRYHGATGGMQGPAGGAKLIDDLEKATPIWKSEEHLPCGWGNAPDRRYGPRPLIASRLAGGTSTPVVKGGVVYQYYYVPAGKGEPVPEWDTTTWDKGWNNPDVIKRLGGGGPFPQIGLDFNAPSATEIVVAMDAATGKTLWKTVAPWRGWNIQTHKWRGINPAPLVHDGVVYHIGYAGFVMALNARTGKLLWDYEALHRPQTSTGGFYGADGKAGVPIASPLFAGGGVVFCNKGAHWTDPKKPGGLVSLDPKTGAQRWFRERLVGQTQLWQHGGKDYVVVCHTGWPRKQEDGEPIGGECLDAETGETVFALPGQALAGHGFMPLIDGDYIVTEKIEGEGFRWQRVGLNGWKLSPQGAKLAWSTSNLLDGDQYAACIAQGHVYLTSPRGLHVFELTTGKQTALLPQGDGHRTNLPFAAGDRLFIQPEGRHGSQGFKMFDLTDPAQPEPLGAADKQREVKDGVVQFDNETLWRPPHPFTTAYAVHPLGYPVVDGRIFIRGNGGVYCYDLRSK